MTAELAKQDPKNTPLVEMEMTYNTLVTLWKGPTIPARYKNSQSGPNDMLAAVLVGKEMGVGPMESIQSIYLVNGQAAMTGKLMGALVHRAGHRIRLEVGAKEVTAVAYRRDEVTHTLVEEGRWKFSEADAKKAGLAGKGPYVSYPLVMYGWRAVSALCRFYFADVVTGTMAYVPEEVGIQAPVEALPSDMEIIVEGEEMPLEELAVENAVVEVVDVLDAEVIQ